MLPIRLQEGIYYRGTSICGENGYLNFAVIVSMSRLYLMGTFIHSPAFMVCEVRGVLLIVH